MKTILTRTAAGLLLAFVALLAAFTTLRLFLHGREVAVPNLTNLSDEDAARAVAKLGLNLSVENRFYSVAITPNHVLSQSPVPGSRVRRGWQVRVTESLGGQRVNVPDVTGQTERPAELILRRLQLEPGATAHLPAPGSPGVVLAQSPPANSAGLSGPHVGLLVSDDEPAANSIAYVMPQLTGLTIEAANARLATAGLRIASATDPTYAPPEATPAVPADPAIAAPPPDPAIPVTVIPPPPVSGAAVISYQQPAAGHKVTRADPIRVSASLPRVNVPTASTAIVP